MPKYVVRPSVITKETVIDFSIFPVNDPDRVNTSIPFNQLEASPELINFALRQTPYHPYRYKENDEYKIGYGTRNDVEDPYAILEDKAYSDWLEVFKNSERRFKRLFPLDSLTQTQYDALVSLHYFTKRWESVGTEVCKFNIKDHILNGEWDYVATAFIQSGADRMRTQAEAKIMMFGNYGRHTPRDMLKNKGLQLIRGNYPNRIKDAIAKQQAEYIYYVETRRFLPGLSQARMRQIVDYDRANN